jgi:hypothetical protein
VGVLLLALPPGLYIAWRNRDRAAVVVAAGVAILFPLSLVPRLAPEGVNISGRSSEYVFAGLACVLGLLLIDNQWKKHRKHARSIARVGNTGRWVTALATLLVTLVFVGEVTIGTPFYEVLRETSHPNGYPWLVQPDAINASNWAREHLGVNQRFAADNLDSLALATYGEQDTITEINVWPIFFASTMNGTVDRDIRSAKIHYLMVDWQMTKGVPPSPGYYFSPQEPGAGDYKNAFPSSALKKFESSTCVRLVYNRAEIEILNVSRIENGSCIPHVRSALKHLGGH